ncbi:hypothetical protein ABIE85_001072 [Bradyrhizobium diazoefficiens]|uniref:hypothetical protein n=1 Tax=Bradyrhizobium diazoefficiens TaxID=1355477 RepID=UPI0035197505
MRSERLAEPHISRSAFDDQPEQRSDPAFEDPLQGGESNSTTGTVDDEENG